MNLDNKQDKAKKITSVSPRRYLGYFPLKSILEKLDINPTLARKRKYEINKLVEKAKGLSVSLAKKMNMGKVQNMSLSNLLQTEKKQKIK